MPVKSKKVNKAKKTVVKKVAVKKAVVKKPVVKKVAVKKAVVKKPVVKKKTIAKKAITPSKAITKTKKTISKKKIMKPAKKAIDLSTPKKIAVKKPAVNKPVTKEASKKTSVAKKPEEQPMKEIVLKEKKAETVVKKPEKATKIKVPEAMRSASVTVVSQILGLNDIKPYHPKKDEKYMGEEMRKHFRKILHAWKHQLMEEVDRTVHHMKDDAANFPDPSDRATQEEEFSLELRTRDRERKLIKKIEEAIELLDEGEYGFCESCGVEIGLRRLEARPTANRCIDCKMLDEIREKQRGG